jgi:hypothetical protein
VTRACIPKELAAQTNIQFSGDLDLSLFTSQRRRREPMVAQPEASECEAVGLGKQRKDPFLTP